VELQFQSLQECLSFRTSWLISVARRHLGFRNSIMNPHPRSQRGGVVEIRCRADQLQSGFRLFVSMTRNTILLKKRVEGTIIRRRSSHIHE
jgi:hypothetical protein